MIRKSFVVLLVIFLSRLIISCCNCTNETIDFDFDSIKITNLDNSGVYLTELEGNTMKRAAVSFRVTVLSEEYIYADLDGRSNWGFSSSYAMECDCYPFFKPNQYIESINIVTQFDISETIKENTLVNDLFRGKQPARRSVQVEDYKTLEEIIVELPKNEGSIDSQIDFELFCIQAIDNDSAQFEIEIVFNDGLILTTSTNQIHLQ